MNRDIQLLDVVALLKPAPEKGLQVGQVGAVVERLEPGVFEVEFCDKKGKTLALVTVKQADLLLLQYELEMT
ncbi:MAG: DUF4926 domain-containing protein [Saprospiraceae bacterium]|nr:DUF4926 domain-containing protein [Saprospiraceae bacterium]